MIVELERYSYAPFGTYGRLRFGEMELFTLEKQWSDNSRNVSCIPEGFYRCERVLSTKFGNTFAIMVPNRTHILFHSANYASELLGCVALGLSIGDSSYSIEKSKAAMEVFFKKMDGVNSFNLHVFQFKPRFNII